jgi:hypothetical protein
MGKISMTTTFPTETSDKVGSTELNQSVATEAGTAYALAEMGRLGDHRPE